MLSTTGAASRHVRHLFDAELRYQDGMAPICELDGRGKLVGSGTGRVEGPGISGTVRWSNFEQVFADHCRLNVMGMIETDDGAEIRFDSQGFAVPPAGEGAWKVASAVRFVVNDSRYRWLDAAPAMWEGEFDATTATARYRAYLRAGPRSGRLSARLEPTPWRRTFAEVRPCCRSKDHLAMRCSRPPFGPQATSLARSSSSTPSLLATAIWSSIAYPLKV